VMRTLREMLPAGILERRTSVVGSGNALRMNPLLQQAAEEVLGLPLRVLPACEEAARGAALLAKPHTVDKVV
jgi:sugar (pentulose or hexulose) kinase